MRRHLYVAAVAWTLSAIVHGAALVALGLLRGGSPGPIAARPIDYVELTASFAMAAEQQHAHQPIQLASYVAPSPPELMPAPQPPEAAPAAEPTAAYTHWPPATAPALAPPPPEPKTIVETQLFGLRGRGNRFVYVFDRSASMEGAPLAAAKRELLASLAELTAANQFQVIFYNDRPLAMPALRGGGAVMTAADELGKRAAANFIGSVFADGATSHLTALNMALSLRPDVLFLLTDANEPRLSQAELAAIGRMNRRTAIHTVEFGVGPPSASPNFLRELAMENGGQHTYIDVTLLPDRTR